MEPEVILKDEVGLGGEEVDRDSGFDEGDLGIEGLALELGEVE